MNRALFLAAAIGAGQATVCPTELMAAATAQPEARAQTAPVPHGGDAAPGGRHR